MNNILGIVTLLTLINSVVLLIIALWSYWVFEKSKKLSVVETKVSTNAHKRAQHIISKALERAGEYLESEEGLEKSQLATLKTSLDNIIRTNLEELEEIVKSSEDNSSKLGVQLETDLKNYFDQLSLNTSRQTSEMLATLSGDFRIDFDKILSEGRVRFEEDYKKSIEEIQAYKQSKIDSLNQQVDNLVAKIAQEVLPKSISLEDHYQLTIDALEKAKQEGFVV